ncbi:hypothetical protein HPP92_016071 [Vanilla planifolia]|uniref:Saposin B-type domain-containing protein n=1 Tax=Vanilla planifolia TaxID=51239 RepID=A0A835QJB8_VANPL|nr:hypothetical protein HPP92_016071 [Vanilla planifolia]
MRQRPFCFISSVSYSKPPQGHEQLVIQPWPLLLARFLALDCKKVFLFNKRKITITRSLKRTSQSREYGEREVRLETKMASLILILLASLVFADASINFHHAMAGDSGCNSCMETSRKAETTLKEISLLKEFDMLSSEVCHFLPGNFETQCLHKSMMQIRHAKLSLQELFREKSLCNSTGLCIDQPKLQDEVENFVENKIIQEFEDERACIACRRAIRELLMKMKQPKLRRKIIESLIDYCEESEDDEDLCKQIVYKYAPTVLAKLEKLKSNEMCFMMGMCDEGMALDEILY